MIKLFGIERIASLTADREFTGAAWFTWLQKQQIPFCIRIKKNWITQSGKTNRPIPVYRLFSGLQVQESMILNKPKKLMGIRVKMIGLRIKKEWVILITNDDPAQALERYKKRWQIEICQPYCLYKFQGYLINWLFCLSIKERAGPVTYSYFRAFFILRTSSLSFSFVPSNRLLYS